MLEWLEVRLDVSDDKRLVYKCSIEALIIIIIIIIERSRF